MKVIRLIDKSSWDFILYGTDTGLVLNVIYCNSFVDTTRSFKVSDKEKNYDHNEFKKLAEDIRQNYQAYKIREIVPVVTK